LSAIMEGSESTETTLNHLLLLGAYRDNEVSAEHPFVQTVNDIKKVTMLSYA
jgi:hypothetical protein